MTEYTGETLHQIIERISQNSASGDPKKWAARVARIDTRLINLAVEVCADAKVDTHESRLEKDALNALARSQNTLAKLMRHRLGKRLKAGAVDDPWYDNFNALMAGFHEQLKSAVVRNTKSSRKQQIIANIEYAISHANAADLGDCDPIPRDALKKLLEWGREQA